MPDNIIFGEMIEELRSDIRSRLTPERFTHTEGVEKTTAAMTEIYAPGFTGKMRAAALLHDFTKEYSYEKQLKICGDFGIILRDDEKSAPQIIHAITAAALIPSEYPKFALPEIIGAVRWHTTGRAGMTLTEKILCLADYIEEGRKYPDCALARQLFWSGLAENSGVAERLHILDRVLAISFENTIMHVKSRGGVVNSNTARAMESLKESGK